jgi:hypothetical protein
LAVLVVFVAVAGLTFLYLHGQTNTNQLQHETAKFEGGEAQAIAEEIKGNRQEKKELPGAVTPPRDRVLRLGERPKTLLQELRRRRTLFVGVVTAKNYLPTRAKAIYESWGADAAKLMFFSSSGSTSQELPVVSLPDVDDTYPPQKKVFRMLKYMHDHYIDEYEWFMRADDDVYVRVERLVQFLDKIDTSKPIYLGQPGFGRPEDRKRLSLHDGEVYCMGGPGVLMNRALLRKLAPWIEDCIAHTVVSWNEDVEIGRCVSRRAGQQCTWSYELERHFFNDYTKKLFSDPNFMDLRQHKYATKALTLHPVKEPKLMYALHVFFKGWDFQQLKEKETRDSEQLMQLNKKVNE